MIIINHQANELAKKIYKLRKEIASNKETKKSELEKLEKKYNNLIERNYPNCVFCSQKVYPSCLMISGCPRNYHNECWIKSKKVNPNLFQEKRNDLSFKKRKKKLILIKSCLNVVK